MVETMSRRNEAVTGETFFYVVSVYHPPLQIAVKHSIFFFKFLFLGKFLEDVNKKPTSFPKM